MNNNNNKTKLRVPVSDEYIHDSKESQVFASTVTTTQATLDITNKEKLAWGHTWQIFSLTVLLIVFSIAEVLVAVSAGTVLEHEDTYWKLVRHEGSELAASRTRAYFYDHWMTTTMSWIVALNASAVFVSLSLLFPLLTRGTSLKLTLCYYITLVAIALNVIAFLWRLYILWYQFTFLCVVNLFLNFFLVAFLLVCFSDVLGWYFDYLSICKLTTQFGSSIK
jgi:hypothetical protein